MLKFAARESYHFKFSVFVLTEQYLYCSRIQGAFLDTKGFNLFVSRFPHTVANDRYFPVEKFTLRVVYMMLG